MENLRAMFGARLKQARLAVPLTQVELAILLKVAQTTVSAWERGIAAPRDDLRPRLATLLHVDAAWLFSYHDSNGDDQAVA